MILRPWHERIFYFLVRAATRPSAAFKLIREHAPVVDVLVAAFLGGASLILATVAGGAPAWIGGKLDGATLARRITDAAFFYPVALALAVAYALVLAPIAGFFTKKARALRTSLAALTAVAVVTGEGAWVVGVFTILEGGTLSPELAPFAYAVYPLGVASLLVLGVQEVHDLDVPRAAGLAVLAALPMAFLAAAALLFVPL